MQKESGRFPQARKENDEVYVQSSYFGGCGMGGRGGKMGWSDACGGRGQQVSIWAAGDSDVLRGGRDFGSCL